MAYGFSYDDRNRLAEVRLGGSPLASYTYNALGQRILKEPERKHGGGHGGAKHPHPAHGRWAGERYAYDEASLLLAEYGATNRDYVWLGSLPVAAVDTEHGKSRVSYVTADGLGTPRAISDDGGRTIWQWAYLGNPWGEQQPTSTTGYVYDLRFPEQYYDQETGLHYNIHRDYDPATGRYLHPDPFGLTGRQWSIYAYVANSPLSMTDSLGMQEAPPEAEARAVEMEAEQNIRLLDAELARELAEAEGPNVPVQPTIPSSEFGPEGMCRELDFEHYERAGPPGWSPNFIVTAEGTAYPVPEGATGPNLVRSGRGMQFTGGSGGNGLDSRTTDFRYMDPVDGPYNYPDGYGSYSNSRGQTINPYTGRTISPSDPMWHIKP